MIFPHRVLTGKQTVREVYGHRVSICGARSTVRFRISSREILRISAARPSEMIFLHWRTPREIARTPSIVLPLPELGCLRWAVTGSRAAGFQ
jgi:hypothetical protein